MYICTFNAYANEINKNIGNRCKNFDRTQTKKIYIPSYLFIY